MKLADVTIRRPVFTIILSALLLLFGAVSYRELGVDLMPKVEAPWVTVTIVYRGADPEVIENRLLKPIEDAISTISGVKRITSSGVDSFGLVAVEFDLEVNVDRAAQDVRDKLAKIRQDLPGDADEPIIEKLEMNAVPVIALVLSGPPQDSIARMTYVADENVKVQLQRLSGVGSVDVVGRQKREVHVVVDPERLRAFGLALPDVQQAVAVGNLDVPGGHVTTQGIELLVKTHGEALSIEQLRQLVVASPMGAPIKLSDVARVEDTAEEARTRSAFDGKRCLSLYVRKQSDANSVAVAEGVIRAMTDGQIRLPPGYHLEVAQNVSTFTRASLNDVVFTLVFGAGLAVLVILLFLRDGRATFIGSLALPTSVVATFAFMRAMNFTMNTLTMLALSLSIGMLIDDAIVVIENIYRHLERGKTPVQAAADGVREIGLAVLATTLSIVAVFVPVAFMKGMAGRFFYEFGLTVAFAVLVSLFISFTLTPMASAQLLGHHHPGRLAQAVGRVLDRIDGRYRDAITWVLRHRAATILSGIGALLLAAGLARFIPSEFMPAVDEGELDVAFNLPEGASLDVSFARGEAIAELARRRIDELQHTLVTVGAGSRKKVNEGTVFLKLTGAKERKRKQDDIAADFRRVLASAFPGADISVSRAATAGAQGGDAWAKPLNVQLRGDDSRMLRTSAEKLVRELLREKRGLVDLSISDRGARPQFGFDLDRDKIAAAGLAPAQVAMAIRTAINGTDTSEYRDGADRYKIVVKAPERYRLERSAILSVPLRGATGNLIEIGELVRPRPEDAPSQIDREDRIRQVTVLGNLEGIALGPAQAIVSNVSKRILPPGVELAFKGQGEIMLEAFAAMMSALLLAIILIYMVLAAQFESFLHPFTIMVSLPLSLVGALGALLITRQTLSIMSFIGIIMLMGLVTKNAILLVDNANQRRAEGKSVTQAMIEAGAARLRPILMTTAAMIFGMLPVAIGLGEGSEERVPMGVAVIGGLLTSTVLTLLVVPAVYSSFESARQRLRHRKTGEPSPPTFTLSQ